MFGFKRKNKNNDENEIGVALIPRKQSFFSKFISFFKRNKGEDFFTSESFYSLHSHIVNAKHKFGEEVYDATIDGNDTNSYNFQQIKELGLINHTEGESTKVIVADFKQEDNKDELNSDEFRKVCFEIPDNYSLEEFLANDGLYELIKSDRLDLENLNYYQVNPVGRIKMEPNDEGHIKINIEDNTEDAIKYAKDVLSENWLKQMKRDKKQQEETRKQEDMEKIYHAPQTSSAFVQNTEKQENRINDNNIRVAPGKKTIYFTDPDNGKTVCLDEVTKVNSVVHNDDNISNLYVTNYTARTDSEEQQKDNQKLAFELGDEDMNELLKNDDERLNLAFRTLFSETNVEQYKDSENLGSRHIGYLKKTEEGYRILMGCKSARTFLNSLKELTRYNFSRKENQISENSEEGK